MADHNGIAFKEGRIPVLYLAAPYSHTNKKKRAARALLASHCAAWLMAQGHCVLSPLSMGHAIWQAGQEIGASLPADFEAWRKPCLRLLEASSAVAVLMLDGVRESRGVNFELLYAAAEGLPRCQIRRDPGAVRPFHIVQNPEWW